MAALAPLLLVTACRTAPAADRVAAPDAAAPAARLAGAGAGHGGEPTGAGRFVTAEAVVASVRIFARPGDATPATVLRNPNPEGATLVFAAIGAQGDWLQVRLPIRPNGSTGWIRTADVALSRHSFRIEVRLAERVLTVYDGDTVVQAEPIGVGRQPTPTPGGSFYLYELLRPADPGGPYGPYAFGLSGFSETLDSFNGGDGRLGLHGTNDPGSLGADSTNGCIRLANPAIEQLAHTVPLGTPVVILT